MPKSKVNKDRRSRYARPRPVRIVDGAAPPVPAAGPRPAVRVDLGCGQNKRQPGPDGVAWVGMDRWEGADLVHDLLDVPWPFPDGAVDELHCSHVLEHFDGLEQVRIMDEAYRVLRWDGQLTVIVPWWNSERMWQDPTHKAPFPAAKGLYFNRGWREASKLSHYPIAADFDMITTNFQIVDPNPASGVRGFVSSPREAQLFALYYYANAVGDLTLVFKKTKRE